MLYRKNIRNIVMTFWTKKYQLKVSMDTELTKVIGSCLTLYSTKISTRSYMLQFYTHVYICVSVSARVSVHKKKRNQAVYFMSNRLRVKYRVIKRWNTSFKQIIYTLFKIYILLLRFFHQTKIFNVLENCFRKFRKRQLYFKSVTDILKMFLYMNELDIFYYF